MTPEERLRVQLRARAWDVAAALPEALELPGPLEEVLAHGDLEVVVTLRRRGPAACGAGAAAPAPQAVQRFLPGCWLTDLERAVVACLVEAGRRRRMTELLPLVEARTGEPVSEGVLKGLLARMADPKVGILSQVRNAKPPGYAVTPEYLAFLSWAEQAARAA